MIECVHGYDHCPICDGMRDKVRALQAATCAVEVERTIGTMTRWYATIESGVLLELCKIYEEYTQKVHPRKQERNEV